MYRHLLYTNNYRLFWILLKLKMLWSFFIDSRSFDLLPFISNLRFVSLGLVSWDDVGAEVQLKLILQCRHTTGFKRRANPDGWTGSSWIVSPLPRLSLLEISTLEKAGSEEGNMQEMKINTIECLLIRRAFVSNKSTLIVHIWKIVANNLTPRNKRLHQAKGNIYYSLRQFGESCLPMKLPNLSFISFNQH